MKKLRIVFVFVCCAMIMALQAAEPDPAAYSHPVSENVRGHENTEWSTAYAYHLTDKQKDLPRVLLVGDSICNGYQGEVRHLLEGKVNVSYWISSYCVTSPNYGRFLSIYLDEAKYDVIHFNNGLHSLGTPVADYEKGMKAALDMIRAKQPKAKIIWASSTPLKDAKKTEKVRELNAAGERVFLCGGDVVADDLFALVDPFDRAANWRDMFHHKPNLIKREGAQVADSVLSALRLGGCPRLMETFGGAEVKGVSEWESVRAPEILERYRREVFGARPKEADERSRVSFEVTDVREAMDGKAVRKLVTAKFAGPRRDFSFTFTVFIPKSDGKVPAFVFICNRPKSDIDPDRSIRSGFWPAEEIVSRGYATAAFQFDEVARDDKNAGFDQGVFPSLQEPSARNAESWASISAWAWAASRVLDWMETEPLIDAKHVGVVGHSRGGKTAIWTGVNDRRFAMTCSNDSGCSGAKLNHIDLPRSESIDRITKVFPHWFCANYRKYAGREREMDFDQHELLALIAPRLLCVASATQDSWAGQEGEWWSAKLASPAWELYGKKGLVESGFPKADAPQQKGYVSYHIRTGKHDLTPYDWKCYMDFADAHGWRSPQSGADADSCVRRECTSGVYPHLAMFNDEGECGTGAVVPWAGDLWVITYGPHLPVGSSDKLYRIRPDLTRETFPGSVGGTPANRMIHRETNQLLIGPYVIDAAGNVRVVQPSKMPGRLTGAARHLKDPANKVYVATMETGLYELDMRTLEVNTLIRENGMNDRSIAAYLKRLHSPWPNGWDSAPVTHVPGYHGKGLSSGFGRVFVANNGENSPAARKNPFVPSGVLAWWNKRGEDWTTIRRCQFTEITTPDGIYGNEHPETNPVWTMGWDAKSVILGVTTNGSAWTYYRLPKASHAYDGAHGWNTEWPRIRDVGFGDETLLATMHGTFWRFPRAFSPSSPNGIRPISTYLKVIGDFCRWGDRIAFGCDDQAKSEFLGTRGIKKGQERCERSQSNIWFVSPNDLASFGPPSGEGYVWLDEDVKAGEVSDPFLHAGYESMRFEFRKSDGSSVRHELLEDGDWVRVKCLENVSCATAHFRYGPKPCETPELDKHSPCIVVADDSGRKWNFPNVNGDTNVVCREISTERDLLYVGGVWYEVPADNAGGFAALRPIAIANEPVKSLRGERGLMYVNGKAMVIDDLWRNGTAPAAYWLWERFSERDVDRSMPCLRRE